MCAGVKNADVNELKVIASEPHHTHTYNVADFSIMNTIVESLTRTVCDGVEQQDKDIKGKNSLTQSVYVSHSLLTFQLSYIVSCRDIGTF